MLAPCPALQAILDRHASSREPREHLKGVQILGGVAAEVFQEDLGLLGLWPAGRLLGGYLQLQ